MQNKREQIDQLRERVEQLPPEAASEISDLQKQIADLEKRLQGEMTAWDHVQLSRHENRPYTLDYISRIFSGFREIHGDRRYGDDRAIVGGMAFLNDHPVMVLGQQKGRNTKERLYRNYGMPNPEGYRKAIRLMHLAEKYGRPVLTFIDTPGAYPGIGAEERGQAQAIAENLRSMAAVRVPIVVSVLGEGGSGGALAIGVGDKVLMLEHAIYSVISPESCSAILWKDQEHAKEAAEALKLTATHLHRFKVIDEIVPEPPGGAHVDWDGAAALLKERLVANLEELNGFSADELLARRYERFRRIGEYQGK
jgi:acetyl-CoA carboxylase carboxyl transferase subunit alpha